MEDITRILSVNDSDLDGIASGAIVRLAHPDAHVTSQFNRVFVDALVLKGLNEKLNPYSRLIVADASMRVVGTPCDDPDENRIVNNQMHPAIQAFTRKGGELVVLDHHRQCVEVKAFYGKYLHADSICETKDVEGKPRAGSELAARYYTQQRIGKVSPKTMEAVREFGALAGDYDVWRDPLGFGGDLARAIEFMADPHVAMTDMIAAIHFNAHFRRAGEAPMWEESFGGTTLIRYVRLARAKMAEAVEEARATAVWHSDRVVEVYTPHFRNEVSEILYSERPCIVMSRSVERREDTTAYSFRRGKEIGLDLNNFVVPLGGGGHAAAAGLRLGNLSPDDLVEHLTDAAAAAPMAA